MTAGDAIHRRILEEPWEDTHRLAYADWLKENGEEDRATYVRLAVERGGPPHLFPGGAGAFVLLDFQGCGTGPRVIPVPVAEPVPGASLVVRRGFVERVELPAAGFTRPVARQIFWSHPVTEVRLTDKGPHACVGGRAGWHLAGPTTQARSEIDRHLYDRLPPGITPELCVYESPAAAHAALSDACVSWGRSLAGLDPLLSRGVVDRGRGLAGLPALPAGGVA